MMTNAQWTDLKNSCRSKKKNEAYKSLWRKGKTPIQDNKCLRTLTIRQVRNTAEKHNISLSDLLWCVYEDFSLEKSEYGDFYTIINRRLL